MDAKKRSRNRKRNEALAKGSQALIRGEIDDLKLVELLKNLEDYVELEGAGGDYYYLSRPESKDGRALKDPDKVFLVSEPRMHGDGAASNDTSSNYCYTTIA